MFDFGFDGVDPRHVEFGVLAFFPDFRGSFFGHHAQFGQLVGGMGLDLKPDAKLGFGRPDFGHLGAGIAGDHKRPFFCVSF